MASPGLRDPVPHRPSGLSVTAYDGRYVPVSDGPAGRGAAVVSVLPGGSPARLA